MKFWFVLSSVVLFCAGAFAQVQVFPTYLALSEERISGHLNLRNTSNEPKIFKVEYVFYKMNKDGTFVREAIPTDGLSDILKFSPKKVTLAPGGKQVVRVMLTDLESLPVGDKYIHLRFVPDSAEETSADAKTNKKSSFSLQAKISVAVPVVVRKGKGPFAGTMTADKATRNKNGDVDLSLSFKNTNQFYLHGDLEIFAVNGDKEISLDKIVGVSSYIPERMFNKTYKVADVQQTLSGQALTKFKVVFKSNPDSGAEFNQVSVVEVSEAKKAVSKRR